MRITIDRVKQIMKQLEIVDDPGKVREDLTFKSQGIDSLSALNIFLAIEEELGIKLKDQDIEKLNTPRQIVDFVSANFPEGG